MGNSAACINKMRNFQKTTNFMKDKALNLMRLATLVILLFISNTVSSQSFTFNMDGPSIIEGYTYPIKIVVTPQKDLESIGRLDVYWNNKILFKAAALAVVHKEESTSPFFIIQGEQLKDDGESDPQQPVIVLLATREVSSDGFYAIITYYLDKEEINIGAKPHNKESYLGICNRLMSYVPVYGGSDNSSNEIDRELPLTLDGHSSSFTSYISGSQTKALGRTGCLGDTISVRTKTGKLISETSWGSYTVSSDVSWLSFPYKTDAAFSPVAEINYTGRSRTATVTVTAGGVSSTMYFTQYAQ